MEAHAGHDDGLTVLEQRFAGRGIGCVRERFRVPAFPRISPCAGLWLAGAGGFLLAAGRCEAAFLVGVAGALVYLLAACGFSPLDWLGPKERRSVLVVPGSPSEKERPALFFGIPLHCGRVGSLSFARGAAVRRAAAVTGVLLSMAFPAYAGAVALLYAPLLPIAGALAGTALAGLAVLAWIPDDAGRRPRNSAASWAELPALAGRTGARPFILYYGGDAAEVKFFLARYRGTVFRGRGVFLEFPEDATGPPAISVGEGPLIPYRVDRDLFARVRAAGRAAGIPDPRMLTLRAVSAGLVAMARGFRAVTLTRLADASPGTPPLTDEAAAAWATRIADGGEDRRRG